MRGCNIPRLNFQTMQPTTPTQAATNAGSTTPPNTEAAHKANFEANFHALVCQPFQDAYDANNVPLYTQIAQDLAEALIGEAIIQAHKIGVTSEPQQLFDRVFINVADILTDGRTFVSYYAITLHFQNDEAKIYRLQLPKILKSQRMISTEHAEELAKKITRRDVKAPESFMLELDDNQTQLALVPTLKKTDIFKFFFELLYPK